MLVRPPGVDAFRQSTRQQPFDVREALVHLLRVLIYGNLLTPPHLLQRLAPGAGSAVARPV